MKELEFRGDSLDCMRDFPESARHDMGFQLHVIQAGDDPSDWKPFPAAGKGVREVRVKTADGAFRAMYVTNIGDCVYVLHAFQKKTEQTSKHDVEIARQRLKELIAEIADERK